MSNDRVNRLLGGSPARVALQLVVLSLIVGVILAAFDLTPMGIVRWIVRSFEQIIAMGFGAVEQVLGYLLLGAAVVIPVWIVIRLLSAGR